MLFHCCSWETVTPYLYAIPLNIFPACTVYVVYDELLELFVGLVVLLEELLEVLV